MQISLKKLTSDCKDVQVVEKINKEAFPPSEYMSMEEIFKFASVTDTDVLGIYNGELPIGFVVITKNRQCGYGYFFAIDGNLRSKGYGSATLKKILEEYGKVQMILDFEALNENAANNEQRIRRRAFYLRNGFHETGRYTLLKGEKFEVVCSAGELNENGLKEILEIIHANVPEFSNVLL